MPWKETLDLNVGPGSEPQAAQFQQADSCVQGRWPSIWGSFLTDASREASSLLQESVMQTLLRGDCLGDGEVTLLAKWG